MGESDPYRVLGVGKDASDSEIQRAYRKKSRQYHPDRNQGDSAAEAKFKEVQSTLNLSALNKPEENTTKESKWKICSEEEIHSEVETHLVDATPLAVEAWEDWMT